MGNTKT